MKGGKGVIIAGFTLYIAAVLQASLAYRFSILGARPDFLLVSLAVLGMFSNRSGGMLIGFFAGLMMGAPAVQVGWVDENGQKRIRP